MKFDLKYWPIIVGVFSLIASSAIYLHHLDVKITLVGTQVGNILTEVKLSNQLYDEKTNSRLSLLQYKVEKCGCS